MPTTSTVEHHWAVETDACEVDAVYKIVLIGNTGVGKSALLQRFADDSFCASHISTIGVDFKVRTLKRDDGKIIKLQLWDTAGQERFRTITTAYYRNADGIILVYAANDRKSFDHVEDWKYETERYARSSCCTMLVENKVDLLSQQQIDPAEATRTAEGMGLPLIRTSAKDAVGVEDAFYRMVDAIVEKRLEGLLKKTAPNSSPRSEKTINMNANRFVSTASWLMNSCSIM
eukprot:CAMPEP_0115867124 /NCGR_PEP_ID=MMETSP0287-20121206/20605_1 /TAXON_ID=412157 /ORGANISM="Chrysochromulina rotalis, Strain UIO044" /LENGTH=230 /DNA_ID=CAMNT_0003321717 /DNA_START=35 /DNA_END=727 /DNA_ORIENTATION=+